MTKTPSQHVAEIHNSYGKQAASLGQILTTAEVREFFDLESTKALWREIDLAEHGAAAVIVWRMEADTGRSPEEEARAERLVACWNACQGLPTEALLAQEPAWEPLTTERIAALFKEPSHTRYWLARVGGNAPAIGHTLRFGTQVCFGVNANVLYATEVTHIMPFTTPELPS